MPNPEERRGEAAGVAELFADAIERAGPSAGPGLVLAKVLARAISGQDQNRRQRCDLQIFGGRRRTRTADPLLVRQVL